MVYRQITRVFFKYDGSGFLPKERWHIWTVDTRTEKAKQLTAGNVYDEHNPRWSPNGNEIPFSSNRSDDPDFDPHAIDLFVMPAVGGECRKIEMPPETKEVPTFSPDGE